MPLLSLDPKKQGKSVIAALQNAIGVSIAVAFAVSTVSQSHAIDAIPLGKPKSNEKHLTESSSQSDKSKKVFLPMSKYGEAII